MAEPKIILQREFATLEDFIKGSNNFFVHFLDEPKGGIGYVTSVRNQAHFKRFQERFPALERELTEETIKKHRNDNSPFIYDPNRLPYERLWEAYRLMSQLVFVGDQDAEVLNPSHHNLVIEIDGKYYSQVMLTK